MTIRLVPVDDAATRDAARDLIAEYLRWIASVAAASYGLSFDIDAMITSDIEDQAKFYPPAGRFYVIRRGESHVGVGCLERITPSVAEIQRMYVQPHVRGGGLGRLLLQQLLSDARAIGYEVVRLESLKFLAAAHALYKSVGFAEITPYSENSMTKYQPLGTVDRYRSNAVFMELRL
ncbi:MAG: GNAT family N-acetyltransferase [Gemmatimonadaceae bacterium]